SLARTPPPVSAVTTPPNGGSYRGANVPASFSVDAGDNSGGVGLNANSTTFILRRGADSFYWTGSGWQAAAFYLATTHTATNSNSTAVWTSNATFPAWPSQADGLHTVQAIPTDKDANR